MRVEGKEKSSLGRHIDCGTWITVLGIDRTISIQLLCRSWKCNRCAEDKIGLLIVTIGEKIRGPHVFVMETMLTKKKLSNFIAKYIRSDYWVIRCRDRSIIISRISFSGSERKSKRKYLKHDLVNILGEPWSGGKRISSRRRIRVAKNDKKPESQYFCYLWGDNHDGRGKEFTTLKNDYQRAKWLWKESEIRLYKKGDELVRRYTLGELNDLDNMNSSFDDAHAAVK